MSTPVPECSGCQALAAEVATLKAELAELRARLDQNSANSSRPPSTDPPWTPKPHRYRPSGRKRGGQKGHPGHQRSTVPAAALTSRQEYVPEQCAHCHAALPADTPLEARVWVHQVYELPEIRPEIAEHVRRACRCLQCGKRTWAPLPPGVPVSGTGPRLHAVVALLTGKGQMSRRNARACLVSWCGLPLALGTISKIERRVAAALAPAVAEVTAAVQAAPVVYCDETSWRERKTRPWLWALSTVEACLFRILDHRDRASFQELCGPGRPGRTLVSDRYSAYSHLPAGQHGYCWAHLDRDFLAVAESAEPLAFLGRYGLEAADVVFQHWHAYQAGALDRAGLQAELAPVQARLRAWLAWGIAAGGKKLAGFFGQLEKHWDSLWVFTTTEGVEPTNNRSERLLRAGVRWRKTSYGTQSPAGRKFAERMLTVTGTLGLQGRPVFPFLLSACQASVGGGVMPRLLLPIPKLDPP